MHGAKVRYRPIVPIHIVNPQVLPPIDACIDSAADDTVFPPHLAPRLGINLAAAPTGQARVIGGSIINLNYVTVTLFLSDGVDAVEWDTVVGFSASPMRWALLGHAGFLEFFDVQLFGASRETVIMPNTAFPGRWIVRTTP
jgi:hypothetical protein